MIKALIQYVRDETLPRSGEIFKGSELWFALVVGVACGYWGETVIPQTTKVSDVGLALLTYAAIAFGFCLAGLTLVLTLPNVELLTRLATTTPPNTKHNSYSSLLFVFTWTSFAHWILIILSVALLVLAGSNQPILPPLSTRHQVMTGIMATLSAYCLFQFLITLFTLSQVGRLNISMLKAAANKAKKDAATSRPGASFTPLPPKTSASN
jgi:hypothetical protein